MIRTFVTPPDMFTLAAAPRPPPPENVIVGGTRLASPGDVTVTDVTRPRMTASPVAGRLADELDETVTVSLPGGDLEVRWAGGDAPVLLRGPAEYAYAGTVEL